MKNILSDTQLTKIEPREIEFQLSHSSIVMQGDEKHIKHIINNLISNAVKYSLPPSPIEIKIELENNTVNLSVSDQGIGIPKKDFDMIFEPFYRGENTEHISGTGLGLSIIKKAVEMHKGEIIVESEEGKGSTFKIILPL